jgi:putative endonuclease
MMYYLYILYSSISDIYYVGYSDNPHKRLIEHNSDGHTTFSRKHRPWELMAIFECGDTRSQVLEIERFIKKAKIENFN